MPPKKYEDRLKRGTAITESLDLGKPGASVGDVEVYEAAFLKGGAQFSFEGAVCHRVRLPDLWHCVVTHKWPKGDLPVQYLEDFSKEPPYRFTITGGTGDYEGAHGEITYKSLCLPQRRAPPRPRAQPLGQLVAARLPWSSSSRRSA